MQTEPVIVSQDFDVSAARVWSAITDPQQMGEWFFEDMENFEPEVGFETEFEVDCEGTIYRHCWRILEVIPEQRIVYGWRYAGVEGDSTVTWELSDNGPGTTLTVTHTAIDPFPASDPNFSSENCESGWQYFIQDRLTDFLSRHESKA